MLIRITKKNERSQLLCKRNDGTYTFTSLNAGTPYHDIAHYVVEDTLNIKDGFFGLIVQGYSIEQLSSPVVIKTLPAEILVAEVITRALHSLYVGACTEDQFIPLIKEELKDKGAGILNYLYEDTVYKMRDRYDKLAIQWKNLIDGESLEVNFNLPRI